MIPRWVDNYAGIPFVEQGSSRHGCNCWGLAALVFFDRTGIQLDRRDTISSEDVVRTVRAFHRGKQEDIWREIAEREANPLDFLLMRSLREFDGKPHKVIDHVGILVSPTHVLHIERGIRSIALPLNHFTIAPRKVSFHRHISQA